VKPAFELAQVIDHHGKEFIKQHHPNAYVCRTLNALQRCRTASLGGHVDRCEECGHIRISYNSCRNRHCPRCQNTQREAWIENRKRDLLPVPYFHVVFTVPDQLNGLFMHHPIEMFNLLFSSAWNTIIQFSFTQLHAETGMVAILHTWGQNLSLHPHLHCIIPGGGLDYQNRWKQIPVSANRKAFLFNVKSLSRVFRGKYIAGLRKIFSLRKDNQIRAFYKTDWVVFSKDVFAGPDQVVEYLGRYTHKVAISNHRLIDIHDQDVTFRWRDYRDGKVKIMSLSGTEFLRRFCLHVLPRGFVRIRHYGLLSSTKRELLRTVQLSHRIVIPKLREKKHWKDICREHLNYDPDICSHCGKGKMITIEKMLLGRSPPPGSGCCSVKSACRNKTVQ
jgi:hypothetical protein